MLKRKIENIFTLGTFKLFLHNFFTPFLLDDVKDRAVTFNQIKGSWGQISTTQDPINIFLEYHPVKSN